MKATRRETLGLATGLLGLAVTEQASAAPSAQRVRLTLAQSAWTTELSVTALVTFFATLVDQPAGKPSAEGAQLLLLPPAAIAKKNPRAKSFYDRLSQAAARMGLFVAGAAVVQSDVGPRTEGFLIGPDGAVLLQTPKVMPDVLGGFSDTVSANAAPAAFPVAKLPFGNIGLLVGEDLYRPSHVRALCFNGAELILNPATEAVDAAFQARCDTMASIAYCNSVYVAAATNPSPSRTCLWDWQGNSSTALGARSLTELIDIESLRVARQLGVVHVAYAPRSLLPMVRDGVYGPTFKANAKLAAMANTVAPANATAWQLEAERRISAQAARKIPEPDLISVYDVALVQSPRRVINGAPDRKAAIAHNISDFLALAEPYARRPMTKLVMFGEFAFTAAGFRTVPDALSATLKWPGPELEQLANFAAKHSVYVAAQQLEEDDKFPGRIFNTAFVFDSAGKLASRHRKIQCVDIMGTLPDTTPGSIYDQYVAAYGAENLFEVLDTPLGKLAPMICFENMFPEVAQIYAQRGAEVYLHLTSEGWDSITETRYAWNSARRQHALEATAYMLSVNQGDDPLLRDSYHVVGECQAIDPYGRLLGMLRESRPGVLVARVDLNLLRAARADHRINMGIWDDPRVYVEAYMQGHGVANNVWADVPPSVFPYADMAVYRDVVARYNARGIFMPTRGPLRKS